ncbi:hypothetical protein V1521DRAFT_427837, partial [Lipomyces starkeyi]
MQHWARTLYCCALSSLFAALIQGGRVYVCALPCNVSHCRWPFILPVKIELACSIQPLAVQQDDTARRRSHICLNSRDSYV